VTALGFVEQYVHAHFTTEERWMRIAAYPRLEEHRALHEAFVAEFLDRQRQLLTDDPWRPLVIEISEWLGAWLRDHVGGVDAEMARFLRAVRQR
jgi:hemerythrin-like metal-binding protein